MPARRLRVLMVCAHEPTMDPRIRWEAESASRRFDVTVLGFNRADGSLPEVEDAGAYRILRLRHMSLGVAQYFWRLKDLIPRGTKALLAALLIPAFPLLVLAELFVRILGVARRLATVSLLLKATRLSHLKATRLSRLLNSIRGRLFTRVYYVLAVLRHQFSPATVLFWDRIRAMPEKPDVVHCNDLDTLLVGLVAKENLGCRVVYDAHEFYPVSDPHGRWIDITFFSALERFLIRRADAVVTVNPMLADVMRGAYGLTRVHAVPNAEPWVEAGARPRVDSPMSRLAAGRLKFLFQGRFTPGRGIDELIEAWPMVDGERAALFLRGPDNMWRKAAMDLAARHGVLDRSVYFLDAVTEDELVSAAAEADVGIIPYKPLITNDRLACPNKLSQYLHAGVMILANDLPYVRSVVEEARAGIFYSSDDLATLAAAVGRIVADPALLRGCRENAVRFARERFNWQAQAEIFHGLYEGRLLDGRPERPEEIDALPHAPAASAGVASG